MQAKHTIAYSAPFLVGGKWVWLDWQTPEANKHAAVLAKAAEVGATRWDFGQATCGRL